MFNSKWVTIVGASMVIVFSLLAIHLLLFKGFTFPQSQVVSTTTSETLKQNPSPTVSIGSSIVSVELALSDEQRTQGLSGRLTMASTSGMLFVFDEAKKYQFWMPDMYFALDMVWIDSSKRVVDITKNALPLRDVSKPILYTPKTPALYVLEVVSGWSDAHFVKIGDKVEFSF